MAAFSFQGNISNFSALPLSSKVLLLLVINGVLIVGYYLTIHTGLTEEIESALNRSQQLRQNLKKAQARQQEYLSLREELAGREVLDRQYQRILPERSEMAAFLGDLDRLTELSGLRVEHVQPKPDKTEEFFIKVPVELALSGKFHQLAKFFYNVSRLERAVNMENLSLTEPHQSGEDIILQVSVLATTFRRQ